MSKEKHYHHGDLHNALLVAAEKLLEDKGVGAVSLREVAKQAGVSHSAPYRHFKDKTALLAALATVGFLRLADAMEHCAQQHPNQPLEQLAQASHAYVDLATQHPQVTNLMFGGVLQPDDWGEKLMEQSNRAFEGLLTLVRHGQEHDLYIDKATDEIALMAWSLAHGFSMLCSAGQLQDVASDKQQIHAMVESMGKMLFNGILKGNSS